MATRVDQDQPMRRTRFPLVARNLLIVLAVSLVIMGCLLEASRRFGESREPITVAPPPRWADIWPTDDAQIAKIAVAPPSRWTDMDHALFDIVLSDISDNPGFGLGGKGHQIVVGDRTTGADGKGLLEVVLSDLAVIKDHQYFVGGAYQIVVGDRASPHDSKRRLETVLEDRDKYFPEEIKADLMSRNPKGKKYSMAWYQPSNPNILVLDTGAIDDDSYSRQFPNARGYILPLLPGYSHDGRMASVVFICGPSLHGSLGYYLLRKVNGHWEIDLRIIYGRPHEG